MEEPLTDEELAILKSGGYEMRGGSQLDTTTPLLRFSKNGIIEQGPRSAWRKIIAELKAQPSSYDVLYAAVNALLAANQAQRNAEDKVIQAGPAEYADAAEVCENACATTIICERAVRDALKALGVPRPA